MSSGRQLRPASLLRVVLAVARVTFMEILRDKVLYNTVVITALLFAVGVLASRLTFIRPDRIILDFGLTGIALSNGLLSVMIGSAMVAREFERRTILVALTKPITRFQFLLGKFAGLKAVLMLNSLLLSVAYLGILKMLGQPGAVSPFTATLGSALFLLALQSLVLAALAIFFSSFSTTSLSVMMTIGVYLVGINTSQIRILALKQESPFAKSAISAVTWFFPNFEHFNLGFKVTYGLPVLPSFVALGAAYATVWCLLLMLMAGWLIQRRES